MQEEDIEKAHAIHFGRKINSARKLYLDTLPFIFYGLGRDTVRALFIFLPK